VARHDRAAAHAAAHHRKRHAGMVTIFKKPEAQTQLAKICAKPAGSSGVTLAARIISDVKT